MNKATYAYRSLPNKTPAMPKPSVGLASKIAAIDPRNPTRKLKAASPSLSGEPMISSHTEARTTGTEQINAKTENTVPATLRFEGL